MKKLSFKFKIISVLVFTSLVLIGSIASSQIDFFGNITTSSDGGSQTSSFLENSDSIVTQIKKMDSHAISAIVNGRVLYQRQVQLLEKLNNAYNIEMRTEEALNRLIMDELYYEEAISRGLQVDSIVAEEYVNQLFKDYEMAENKEEVDLQLFIIMESLEMTEDEYKEWVIKEYEKLLSIVNLRNTFLDQNKNFNSLEYDKLGEELYNKADIEIK